MRQYVMHYTKLKLYKTMKSNLLHLSVILLLLSVSACTWIKNYFPDKSKEYQLASEIPALIIPPDLPSGTHTHKPKPSIINKEAKIQQILADTKKKENSHWNQVAPEKAEPRAVEIEAAENKATIYVELIEYSGGETRIRIKDGIEKIWRTVGKALSRHSIEIIDRDALDHVYFVQYDANFTKVEDGSLWDEVVFIFGSDPAQEEEFRVKLVEYGGFIEIIVLDDNNIPLSTGMGLKLLKTLYRTIKEDLAV